MYKINTESCISCDKKNQYLGVYNTGYTHRLCQECMYNKYDELKKQYSVKELSKEVQHVVRGTCLITDD